MIIKTVTHYSLTHSYQSSFNTCGPTSLKMVMSSYGFFESEDYFKQLCQTKSLGTSSEVFDNLDKKKFYECEDCGEIFRETESHVDNEDKLVCQNCGSESIKEREPTAVTFGNSVLKVKGVFDSSDIDSANEYAKEKNIVVAYNGKKGEFTFTGEGSVLKEIEELFADQSVELTWE